MSEIVYLPSRYILTNPADITGIISCGRVRTRSVSYLRQILILYLRLSGTDQGGCSVFVMTSGGSCAGITGKPVDTRTALRTRSDMYYETLFGVLGLTKLFAFCIHKRRQV